MTSYGFVLLVSCIISFALFLLQVKRKTLPLSAALLSIPCALVFGALFSKLVYVLCFLDFSMIDEYWFEDNFLRLNASEFSVFGGALGVCFGILGACRLCRTKALPYLDLFAPCGAILLCGIRFGEMYLNRLGVGDLLAENSPLARFPFAIQNEYGEWFASVFLLEALFALICAVVLFIIRLPNIQGIRLELTAFFLAVPQVFCESLRARCMKWGFVRIEQLFCGLLLLLLVTLCCRKARQKLSFMERYWPVAVMIASIGLIVFVEFALDKFNISDFMCYTLMILALCTMSFMEIYSMNRRCRKA